MVDYRDPDKVADDFATLVKLYRVTDGIFIWEFLTTLDYEWDVVRGRRPYRWTIWIYSLTRVATLLTIIFNIIGVDTTIPINCQVWATLEVVCPSIVFGSASLLIMIRIIAIWNRERIVVAIAMCVWLTDVAFLIDGSIRLRATRSAEDGTCLLLNPGTSKPNIISSLITDVVLLVIMLIGLLRLRIGTRDTFGLARILWQQGIIWLLLATVAEVPPSVLICLNVDDPLKYIFQAPNMVTLSIGATRMYRSLTDFASSDILCESNDLRGRVRMVSKIPIRSGPMSLSGIESLSPRVEVEPHPAS